MILNTRPSHQSTSLESQGTAVFSLPVFSIEPIDCHVRSVACNHAIFVSANAVDCFFVYAAMHANHIFAVGDATQQSLKNKGFFNTLIPDEFSSEGLLQMPLLQDVQGKSVSIVCGENTKPLLQETLIQRGAQVTQMVCYRRVPIDYDMTVIFPKLLNNPIDSVLTASYESLQQLMVLFKHPEHQAWLLNKKLYVMTEKMREEAVKLGFGEVLVEIVHSPNY